MYTSSSHHDRVFRPLSSLWVPAGYQSGGIDGCFGGMLEHDSFKIRQSLSNFLTHHIASKSLLSTSQVAVVPCYGSFEYIAQSLDEALLACAWHEYCV
jgi:hypothetical protein